MRKLKNSIRLISRLGLQF